MKLIFFLVAGTVLCFGYRMRIMLITCCCLSWHWAVLTLSQGFFRFSHCPVSREGGEHKKLGGRTAKTVDPHWPKGNFTSYVIVLNYKTGENCPGIRGCLDIGQQAVRSCVVHHLFVYSFITCIIFISFTVPLHCLSLNAQVLPCFPSLSHLALWGEWAAVWWLTPCWIKLQQ